MRITVEYVKARVEVIKTTIDDPEAAHELEDSLHEEVLEGIADGSVWAEDAADVASAALETKDLEFSRWCA